MEIERLVLRLENLFIEGASLEPTLLERIRINISRFSQMADEDLNKVYTWWNDLNNDFVRLNQNYQDYIRDLNSVKAEEMMHTKESFWCLRIDWSSIRTILSKDYSAMLV